MHSDIEFIKYCVSKVDDVKIGCDGDRIIFPDNQSIPLNSLSHFPIHAKYLISQTCDALGICIVPTSTKNNWYSELDCSDDEHATADEARIAAIKKYMEVEG